MPYKFTITAPDGAEHKALTFKAAKRIAQELGPGCRINGVVREERPSC